MPNKETSSNNRTKRLIKHLLPPLLYKQLRKTKYLLRPPVLEYAPQGWQTPIPNGNDAGWNASGVVNKEKAKMEAFRRNLMGSGPLGFSHEFEDMRVVRNVGYHNVHISYAYVLALAARKKDVVSVLDYGGGLGHYYLVGKAVLPDVELDFHVKEVPALAAAGREVNPDVHWHDTDDCLERQYDLVMLNGSTPYMPDWCDFIHRAAGAVGGYFFLFRQAIVTDGPSFVAIQRHYNSAMLHQQINETDLLNCVAETGLTLVREFVVGDRPYIKNAPEQCELRGWLYKRG